MPDSSQHLVLQQSHFTMYCLSHAPSAYTTGSSSSPLSPAYTSRRDNLSATICLRLVGDKLSATRCVTDTFAGESYTSYVSYTSYMSATCCCTHYWCQWKERLPLPSGILCNYGKVAGLSTTKNCPVQWFDQRLRKSKCVTRTYPDVARTYPDVTLTYPDAVRPHISRFIY